MSREIKGWQLTVGLLAVASLSANYLKGSNPEFQHEKEQEFAKSGDLSTSERIHGSLVGQALDGASRFVNNITHSVADKAEEFHDAVLSFPAYKDDNITQSQVDALIKARSQKLTKYFVSPWLQEGQPASLAFPFVNDIFSMYGQLGDPKCSVSVYKLDRSTEQYKTNQAMLESNPGHNLTIYDAKHATTIYCLGITGASGNTEYKFFRLYTASASARKFNYKIDPCANPNCINDVKKSEDTKNSIINSGTTFWEGGREIPIPRSNEKSQSEMMRRVDEVKNANSQIRVEPLNDRNITRKENPSENNYPPCDNMNFDMRPVGNGVLGVGERYGSFKGNRVICRKIN